MRSRAPACLLLSLAVCAAVCGCGRSEKFHVAAVKGRVLLDGAPAPGGIVTFSPVGNGSTNRPGKTAMGEVQPDGEFVLSTYVPGDGAVIGRCRVTAAAGDPDAPAWACELAQPLEYEVQPGKNTVVIELLPDGTGRISSAG